ncbi:MAG: alginate O-acetyltransferase AlgX-related protein [Pseudomonadales bacterium]
MTKDLAFKTITILLGLGIALLLSEVTVRAVGAGPELVYKPNPYYGWSHTANDEFARNTEGREVTIRINSQGLRDSEHTYAKSSDFYRILILGDSFTEAFQVPLDQSFPKLLEGMLNENKRDDQKSVEIVNAGASGYGTDNALLFFRHEGYKYEPDLVLLALYIGNDIRNNWFELENIDAGGFRKPYFVLSPNGLELNNYPFERASRLSTRIKLFLNRHVRTYAFTRRLRDSMRYRDTTQHAGMPMDFNIYRNEYPKAWDKAWQITKALIAQMHDELSSKGIRLLLVLIPSHDQVSPRRWKQNLDTYAEMRTVEWDLDKPNRMLGAFLSAEEIPYVELLEEFRHRTSASSVDLYLPVDGHWQAEGHLLAARLIAEGLLSHGLLAMHRWRGSQARFVRAAPARR